MASELVIRYTCDRCEQVAVEGDAGGFHPEVRVTVSDQLDRQVDLCDGCYADTVAAIVEGFADLGVDATNPLAPRPSTSTSRPVGRPRGRGAATPESQRALLERHPDAIACPACLILFTPGAGDGYRRRKYLSSHMARQHDKRPTDYTAAQFAEADARARAQLRVTS